MSFDNIVAWKPNEKRMLKYALEQDGICFMRYFFKAREGDKMIRNWHHYVIEYVLQAVFDGEITRLIINIAPGYSKTELAVLNFIARGLAINPRAKFIHASYSDQLAQQNSQKIKDTVLLPEFQELWPMLARTDSKSKKRWFTEHGGGMMAAPTRGQITGFRAGRMESGFTGAFVLDDPVKPDDAYHTRKRKSVNENFTNTMRSRLALESVPMIVIMQRIHDDDLTGHLLRGGSGDTWHHLSIPALLSEEILAKPYPRDYTHGIQIPPQEILTALHSGNKFDFSQAEIKTLPDTVEPDTALWPPKHTKEDLLQLASGDEYTFSSQMQHDPSLLKGGMFKDSYWRYYDIPPLDIYKIEIFCDTAQKTQEHNDYTVFQCWGKSRSGGIYLLDQARDKWTAPSIESNLIDFWNKHKLRHPNNVGASKVWVEDKSSGSSLIQSIQENYDIPIEGIPRNTDKVLRAFGVVNFFAGGFIFLPKEAEWLYDYKEEFRKFSPLMTHKHDDQIDPTMDAVEKLLIGDGDDYLGWVSNKNI